VTLEELRQRTGTALEESRRLVLEEGALAAKNPRVADGDMELLRRAARQWLDATKALQSVRSRLHTGIERRGHR